MFGNFSRVDRTQLDRYVDSEAILANRESRSAQFVRMGETVSQIRVRENCEHEVKWSWIRVEFEFAAAGS